MGGVINWVALGGILVDLVIISILISTTYWGFRRGLVAVVFKVLMFIVSLVIMFLLYKPVSAAIINKTQLDEKLSTSIAANLSGTVFNEETGMIDTSNSNFSNAIIKLIESFVNEALKLNDVNPLQYTSTQLAYFMIRVLTMLFLLILSRFFLQFVRFAAELIANLPFIKMFNKSGGLLFGLIKGFLIIYIILAIFSVLSPIISEFGIISAINDSTLGNKMYNNNILINLILRDETKDVKEDEPIRYTNVVNTTTNTIN